MANQRLDELASIGAVDRANDLLYIVDSSEGLTGSRKVTVNGFQNLLDADLLPNSKEGRSVLAPVAGVVTLDFTDSLVIRDVTLVANSSLVINNPQIVKTITLEVSGAFDFTLPGSCVVLSGTHSFLADNVYTILCVNDTTDKYYVTIRQE